MLNESEREHHIPGTYYLQNKLRQKNIHHIAQEEGYSRDAVEQAIIGTLRSTYRLSRSHPSPVSGPYYMLPLDFKPGQMVAFPHLLVCA